MRLIEEWKHFHSLNEQWPWCGEGTRLQSQWLQNLGPMFVSLFAIFCFLRIKSRHVCFRQESWLELTYLWKPSLDYLTPPLINKTIVHITFYFSKKISSINVRSVWDQVASCHFSTSNLFLHPNNEFGVGFQTPRSGTFTRGRIFRFKPRLLWSLLSLLFATRITTWLLFPDCCNFNPPLRLWPRLGLLSGRSSQGVRSHKEVCTDMLSLNFLLELTCKLAFVDVIVLRLLACSRCWLVGSIFCQMLSQICGLFCSGCSI